MAGKLKKMRTDPSQEEAELDITAFMNLMIVLVPVLLLSMVFSHVAVLELKLPEKIEEQLNAAKPEDTLSLKVTEEKLELFFPANVLLKAYALDGNATARQMPALVEDLKLIKQRLATRSLPNTEITLMPAPGVEYQLLVSVMDKVRSYPAVVAASVVEAELFPDISFLDYPQEKAGAGQAAEAKL